MRRLIAPFVGIVICLAVFAAPVAAAPNELFGISKGQPLVNRDFAKMKRTGIHSFRMAINWFLVEPRRNQTPSWGLIDPLIGNLAAHGIRPMPFIYGTPRWVARRPNHPPLQTQARQEWREFLTAVVNRYKPGGIYWTSRYRMEHPNARPLPIKAYQIWNEPTLPKFFPRTQTAQKYAQLVRISDSAIAAASPSAKVILAGLTGFAKPRAWTFLKNLYRVNGIKSSFDATAIHPYAATIGQFKKELRKFRRVMRKNHDGRTPVWLTEVGWGSEPRSRNWPLNKGVKGQKRMLQKSFRLILQKRRAWKIKRLFWFDWRDPAKGQGTYCSFCDSAGLLKHNHKAKPSYRAFRRFAR
jgi:hypothetical protein